MDITHLSRRRAQHLLAGADGKVKAAVVMHLRQVDLKSALEILAKCDQSLRKAIQDTE
jgi:N-acetylmuramic acid 6-phosphate (MurNAc-6-P) etherase